MMKKNIFFLMLFALIAICNTESKAKIFPKLQEWIEKNKEKRTERRWKTAGGASMDVSQAQKEYNRAKRQNERRAGLHAWGAKPWRKKFLQRSNDRVAQKKKALEEKKKRWEERVAPYKNSLNV